MKDIKTHQNSMTRLIKVLCILSLSLLLSVNTRSQNLRDLEHSLKFADYLFVTQQFELSAEEFERVVYLDSTNSKAILKLLASYRMSGKSLTAEQRFNTLFKQDIYSVDADISKEYVANMIINKKYEQIFNYLEQHKKLDNLYKQTYQLGSLMLQNKKNAAYNYARGHIVTNDKKNSALHLLALKYKMMNYKKSWLAAGLSSIIPGAGKFYSKNWKDGLISFVTVGVNAWQSYRGFKKYGTRSAYGWIFAGLAGSFHISNIFGSYKSAKKYNKKLDDEIRDEALHIMLSSY